MTKTPFSFKAVQFFYSIGLPPARIAQCAVGLLLAAVFVYWVFQPADETDDKERKDVAEIAQLYPADIYVGSHTHRTMTRNFGKQKMINTGAVGTPFNGDPRAQYILLSKVDDAWQIDFQAVPYDRKAAIQAFETSGYLTEGGLSARIFYEELCSAKAFYGSFWGWTDKKGVQKIPEEWALFKQEFALNISLQILLILFE